MFSRFIIFLLKWKTFQQLLELEYTFNGYDLETLNGLTQEKRVGI